MRRATIERLVMMNHGRHAFKPDGFEVDFGAPVPEVILEHTKRRWVQRGRHRTLEIGASETRYSEAKRGSSDE